MFYEIKQKHSIIHMFFILAFKIRRNLNFFHLFPSPVKYFRILSYI
jgi:hypothetical protein